jgi:hypothetical protein
MLMNLVAERDNFVAIVINRACDLGMSVHRRTPLEADSTLSTTPVSS